MVGTQEYKLRETVLNASKTPSNNIKSIDATQTRSNLEDNKYPYNTNLSSLS